jgi:hypothetical protein
MAQPRPILRRLWDPRTVLGVEMATCIGKADKGGRDCENPTGRERQTKADKLLNKLAIKDPKDSNLSAKIGAKLARELLCHHHRPQVNKILNIWKQRYAEHQEQAAAREIQNQSQPVDSGPPTSLNEENRPTRSIAGQIELQFDHQKAATESPSPQARKGTAEDGSRCCHCCCHRYPSANSSQRPPRDSPLSSAQQQIDASIPQPSNQHVWAFSIFVLAGAQRWFRYLRNRISNTASQISYHASSSYTLSGTARLNF